jgi:hypothetical protein
MATQSDSSVMTPSLATSIIFRIVSLNSLDSLKRLPQVCPSLALLCCRKSITYMASIVVVHFSFYVPTTHPHPQDLFKIL